MKQRLALGIDAGGSYTDLVVLDRESGCVIDRCKSPTTRPDPSKGIRTGLAGLATGLLADLEMVSLATTFATNAMVKEVGAEAGLILIGYEEVPALIPRSVKVLRINGGHNAAGEERTPLDLTSLERNLDSFVPGLDALAITGFFSIKKGSF